MGRYPKINEYRQKVYGIYHAKTKGYCGRIIKNGTESQITLIFKPTRNQIQYRPRMSTKEKIKKIEKFIVKNLKEWGYQIEELVDSKGSHMIKKKVIK